MLKSKAEYGALWKRSCIHFDVQKKMTELQEQLFKLQDLDYKKFHAKLIPNIPAEKIIGIRTPQLRSFASSLFREAKSSAQKKSSLDAFLHSLPHELYEENNLHGFLIEKLSGFEECVLRVSEFLPFIDNWATCDMLQPKAFKKNPELLLPHIKKWIASEHTYTCRFGIGMLMSLFLDERFKPEYLCLASEVRSSEYYVNMMVSWFFATALAKQWDCTVRILEEKKLSAWCHNKAIQKAVESLRISREQKEYLKTLKISR